MWLFLIFVIVPIVEIAILVTAGQEIGAWPVIGLVILSALVGSIALRQQGVATLRRLQSGAVSDLSETLTDGLLLVIAGVCLVTPGFVTDGVGLSLLIPGVRRFVARELRKRMVVVAARAETRRPQPRPERAEPADAEHPFAKPRADRVRPDDAEDAVILSEKEKRRRASGNE